MAHATAPRRHRAHSNIFRLLYCASSSSISHRAHATRRVRCTPPRARARVDAGGATIPLPSCTASTIAPPAWSARRRHALLLLPLPACWRHALPPRAAVIRCHYTLPPHIWDGCSCISVLPSQATVVAPPVGAGPGGGTVETAAFLSYSPPSASRCRHTQSPRYAAPRCRRALLLYDVATRCRHRRPWLRLRWMQVRGPPSQRRPPFPTPRRRPHAAAARSRHAMPPRAAAAHRHDTMLPHAAATDAHGCASGGCRSGGHRRNGVRPFSRPAAGRTLPPHAAATRCRHVPPPRTVTTRCRHLLPTQTPVAAPPVDAGPGAAVVTVSALSHAPPPASRCRHTLPPHGVSTFAGWVSVAPSSLPGSSGDLPWQTHLQQARVSNAAVDAVGSPCQGPPPRRRRPGSVDEVGCRGMRAIARRAAAGFSRKTAWPQRASRRALLGFGPQGDVGRVDGTHRGDRRETPPCKYS